jgi:hypothetical protein
MIKGAMDTCGGSRGGRNVRHLELRYHRLIKMHSVHQYASNSWIERVLFGLGYAAATLPQVCLLIIPVLRQISPQRPFWCTLSEGETGGNRATGITKGRDEL